MAITLTLTSGFAFSRGHDTPDRYEWEAQLNQIQEQERNPSSEAGSFKFEVDNSESFKQHYSSEE